MAIMQSCEQEPEQGPPDDAQAVGRDQPDLALKAVENVGADKRHSQSLGGSSFDGFPHENLQLRESLQASRFPAPLVF